MNFNNEFKPNKTPIKIINEGAFGGTYFRDKYSNINDKWYRNSWTEFSFLKGIDKKLCASKYYDISVNKYNVQCGTSLRFWENKRWINSIDPYGWFQWYCSYYLGTRSNDDERQIKRWINIINRFKSILVNIIKNRGTKYNDYSVSPKIRQILLHWGYEITKSDCI